jgi:hypothetical protein
LLKVRVQLIVHFPFKISCGKQISTLVCDLIIDSAVSVVVTHESLACNHCSTVGISYNVASRQAIILSFYLQLYPPTLLDVQ